jgi:hypothetical protein
MTPSQFAANFSGIETPHELASLLAFQNDQSGFESYSEGFGLLRDDKGGLRSWSTDEVFLARLSPFAQANGSGSFYALWADGAGNLPVIAFGDEGGVHVVAESVRGLLQILAFDAEPMIDHDGVTYYKSDGKQPSSDHAAYLAWLGELGLDAADDPTDIVAAAQGKHKAAFDQWITGYVD